MAAIREGAVKLKGNPVSLMGPALAVGDAAPDFSVQGADLSAVNLAASAGKTRIIAAVPSLDTPVCQTEAKRFAEEIGKLDNVEMLCISMDLPFAQKRWCGSEGVENISTLSDHADASFGEAYGVLMADGPLRRLHARAVFVVGTDDKIKHVEYVGDIAQEPDYDAALSAAKS